jgi:hypothetical protein
MPNRRLIANVRPHKRARPDFRKFDHALYFVIRRSAV